MVEVKFTGTAEEVLTEMRALLGGTAVMAPEVAPAPRQTRKAAEPKPETVAPVADAGPETPTTVFQSAPVTSSAQPAEAPAQPTTAATSAAVVPTGSATKEQVTDAMKKVIAGPGAAVAQKAVMDATGAKSISTMDPSMYAKALAALEAALAA